MLLTHKNVVIDISLYQLTEFLQLIDSKLNDIYECISESINPESDGLLDRGEYFIGIAFVAIQQHLTESLIGMKTTQKVAYSLGKIHPSGETAIWVMNAAANWWKHEAQWFEKGEYPSDGNFAFHIIMTISNQHKYALSNVFASFSESNRPSFINDVIPYIAQWTKQIHASSKGVNA